MGVNRILIVEDDADLRFIIQSRLSETFPIELVVVESGNKAIGVLKGDKNFSLIISDYMMPDGSGLDVLRFKVDQRLEIPFVFFTSTVDLYIPFNEADYLGVIAKWHTEDLLTLVANTIDNR